MNATESVGRRRAQLLTLVAIVMVLFAEATAYVVIHVASRTLDEPIRRSSAILAQQTTLIGQLLERADNGHVQIDSVLGWRYRAGFRSETDSVTSQGLRGSREYAQAPMQGTNRIAAFGDSFVYGNEVGPNESWPAILEQLDAKNECLNYGVGGYGIDQAYLRYLSEGAEFSPEIVIIGFVADDIRRLTNVYRRFRSNDELPLFKPRFVLRESDSLELLPAPVRTRAGYAELVRNPTMVRHFGQNDKWYQPLVYENPLHDWSAVVRLVSALWIRIHNRSLDSERDFQGNQMNPHSSGFRIQTRLFERFALRVKERGAHPVVLFLPEKESIKALMEGGQPLYARLRDSTAARSVPVLDLGDAFTRATREQGLETLFRPGGHYSSAGNRVVAEALRAWLASR